MQLLANKDLTVYRTLISLSTIPPLVVDDNDTPSLINDEEAYVGPRKMKAAADGTSLDNHRCADNHDDDEYEYEVAIEQGEER